MQRRTLTLDAEARAQLASIRDHDSAPYRRERAAALVKIADGMAPHAVALHGLLKPRDPDTVYGWLDDDLERGLEALTQAPRRTRFSPL